MQDTHFGKNKRGQQVRLPALNIPSDPPKFEIKKKVKPLKTLPSKTSCLQSNGDMQNATSDGSDNIYLQNPDHLPKEESIHLPPICGIHECLGVVPDGYGGGIHLCGMVNTRALATIPGGSMVNKRSDGKHLAYGTSNWMQLLVSGQLPPHVLANFLRTFTSTNIKPAPKDMNFKYTGPPIQRQAELWEPKRTPPPVGSAIEKNLLEANYRHKNRLNAISLKCKQQTKKAEKNLFRKANSHDVRIAAYLDKLDRRTKVKQQRNKNNSTRKATKSEDNIIADLSYIHLQTIWDKIKGRLLAEH